MSEAGSGDPEQTSERHAAGNGHPAALRRPDTRHPDACHPEARHPEARHLCAPEPDTRRPVPPQTAAVIPISPPAGALSTPGAPHQGPSPGTPHAGPVTFNQAELRVIFGLYGRKVAAGEWRDYAIDFLRHQAVFSVYRRSSEVPLYRIEKTPRLARKQGEYAAVAASGLILKRGGDLARVLAVLDRPLKVVR